MTHRTSQVQRRRGQATLELAVVLPVLATLLMGVMEFGFMLHSYITLVNVGREGARIAADGATNCEIRNVIGFEGGRELNWVFDGAVLIVRGHTARQSAGDTVGSVSTAAHAFEPNIATAWVPDPTNPTTLPSSGPAISLKAQRSNIHGLSLDNSEGFEFVIVEVHYLHRTLSGIPFAGNIQLSTYSLIRTAANNVNDC